MRLLVETARSSQKAQREKVLRGRREHMRRMMGSRAKAKRIMERVQPCLTPEVKRMVVKISLLNMM